MRQPKLNNLVIDTKETKIFRKLANKPSKIKITINIDEDSLRRLKSESNKTGIPYQRLINQLLKESLKEKENTFSRLDKLERELLRLKKKVA